MRLWPIRTSTSRPTMRRANLRLLTLEGRDMPSSGGFTGGGIRGEYFDNPELAGNPAFVRTDVRVDFDWQDLAPGGSSSAGYNLVGADDFSVRWTGTVLPKYSEVYTFHATGDDGVRLLIRPAGTNDWTVLVDTWAAPTDEAVTATFEMGARQPHEVRLEYRELEGTATAKLAWSAVKTPYEIIEPATQLGINAVTYDYYLYADAAKMGRPEWGDPTDYFGKPKVTVDSLGWPVGDAGKIFWSGRSSEKTGGIYRLQFTGQAEVTGLIGRGEFRVDGINVGRTLPFGVGYDPETNTTTADVLLTDGTDLFGLNFVQTRRLPEDVTATGVTDVKLMRPTSSGSTTAYAEDVLFDAHLTDAMSRFTSLRFLTANFNAEKEWSDRKLPGAMQAAWGDRAAVWEHEILLANETGKDLYITVPVMASTEYIRNLANLLKYGSDGVNAYTETTPDGIYPGLNPNLRVYVEWGNEFWNWSFSHAGMAAEAGRQAVLQNTPDGKIINFDGQRPGGDFRRWAALKTVQMSNEFRGVWGDAAMGEAVRVLYEFQYDNQQHTAHQGLQFIDRYFNNGDGTEHVADPKPVNHYIWGAGGAAYFGAANPRGLLAKRRVPGAQFEKIAANPGGLATPTPSAGAWTFTGDAGIYRNLAKMPGNMAMNVPGIGSIPATTNGLQAMYISGTGTVSVTIKVPKPGLYAIDFLAAGKFGQDKGNLLDFYFNDVRVTPNAEGMEASPFPWWPGNGNRDAGKFSNYGTVPVQIDKAGSYTFKIVGRGAADRTAVIDDVRLARIDEIFKSAVPTGVKAAGQVSPADLRVQLETQAAYVKAYGLEVVAYEGGWSLGGDSAANPLMSYAKYNDPRAAEAMAKSIDAFHQAGGSMYIVGSFDQFHRDDSENAGDYPIIKGIDDRLTRLPDAAVATNRMLASTLILPASAGVAGVGKPGEVAPGEWIAWTVDLGATGHYLISALADVDGRVVVFADGVEVGRGSSGEQPGGVIRLSAGPHTIRVQNTGGWYGITGLRLELVSNPQIPKPGDPEPTDPVDPEPTDPTEEPPTEPVDPNPTDPTDEPEVPVDPDPTDEPETPVEEPEEPIDPNPSDPTEEPEEPVDPNPTDPTEEPEEPVDPNPTDPTDDPETPTEEPVDPNPTDPTEEPEPPVDPDPTDEPETPVEEPEEPVDPNPSDPTEEPVDPDPTDPTDPTEEPEQPTNPVEPDPTEELPTEPVEPDPTEPVENPEPPADPDPSEPTDEVPPVSPIDPEEPEPTNPDPTTPIKEPEVEPEVPTKPVEPEVTEPDPVKQDPAEGDDDPTDDLELPA